MFGKSEFPQNPLDPRELNALLGNLLSSHRAKMSYDETKKKLSENYQIQPAHSSFMNIHHSFWGVLQEELESVPVRTSSAIHLLSDIRSRVISLLTPTSMRLKSEVDILLSEEVLLSKARKGNLHLKACAVGVLQILEMICIPRREPQIRKLLKTNDILPLYKGLIALTDEMKRDMAKYAVAPTRSLDTTDNDRVVDKVADFMYHLGGELPMTESWLEKHFDPTASPNEVVHRAVIGLLTTSSEPYPETMMMFIPQLEALRRDYYQLIISVSVVLTFLTFTPVMCTAESREALSSLSMNLLRGIRTDGELTRALPYIFEQMRNNALKKLRDVNNKSLTESILKNIAYQVELLSDPRNKVRRSVTSRVKEYLSQSLRLEGSVPVPDSLHFISAELTEISARLNSIVMKNLENCTTFYMNIITNIKRNSEKSAVKRLATKKQSVPSYAARMLFKK